MRRNILISAFGSAGDVLPYIAVGAELKARGHQVTLISNPYFAEHAGKKGLEISAVGTLADYQKLMTDEKLFQSATGTQRVAEHFSGIVTPLYTAMLRLQEPGRTVLFAPWEPGLASGLWVGVEKLAIPYIGGVICPSRMPSKYDPPSPPRSLPPWAAHLARTKMGLRGLHAFKGQVNKIARVYGSRQPRAPHRDLLTEEINRLRVSLNLAELGGSSNVRPPAPKRIVCMWPDWFAARQKDWPRQASTTGFPYTPHAGTNFSTPLNTEQRKLLVFTAGSMASGQHLFFEKAVDVCSRLGRPGLLIAPHGEEIPRPLPGHVSHVESAAFHEVFREAALIVHHGGIGTVALALAAGVPQFARPIAGEQFDISNRLQRLGIGRMIDIERMSAARLADLVSSFLTSKQVLKRCRYWGERVRQSNAAAECANAVESLPI